MILVFTQFYLFFFLLCHFPLKGHCGLSHGVIGRFSGVFLTTWISTKVPTQIIT